MTDTSKEAITRTVARLREMLTTTHGWAHVIPKSADLIEALAAERDVQHGIVARIWGQLGNPNYDELAGRSIHDLIDELKTAYSAAAERAEKAAALVGEIAEESLAAKTTLGIYAERLAAEQARVAALEGALTRIRDGEDAPNMPQLGCGVEDRDLQSDGYGAVEYGWNDAEERFLEWARNEAEAALSAPPAPTTVNDPLTVGAVKGSLTTSAPAVSQAAADVLADLRATIAKLETPNQYWDAEDPEDSYATDPTDVLDRSDPPPGVAVKLFCSRSLPAEWGIAIPTKFGADGEIEESDVITFPTEAEAIAAYEDAKERLDRAAEREG